MYLKLQLITFLILAINFNLMSEQKEIIWENIQRLEKDGRYLESLSLLNSLESNDPDALFLIADYYYNGRNGITQNKEKAKNYYKKVKDILFLSAENGNAISRYKLGISIRYADGNYKEAFDWILKSANAGFDKAQAEIALCYIKGLGVKRNNTEAMAWLQKALSQDNITAKAYMASYLFSKKKELKKALLLAIESAAFCDPMGQYTLGMAYEKGIGIDKDLHKALELYQKAAGQGLHDAKLRINWLMKK